MRHVATKFQHYLKYQEKAATTFLNLAILGMSQVFRDPSGEEGTETVKPVEKAEKARVMAC